MKVKVFALIAVALLGVALWHLAEPQACRDLDYDYSGLSVVELGVIASTCRQQAMARLYYQRAYSADLFIGRRVEGSAASLSALANAHRLYLGMVEAFAPHWFPDEHERLDFLNQQYEQATRLAELQLRQWYQFAEARRSAD